MKKTTIDTDDLNRQYLPSLTVANPEKLLAASARRSGRVRNQLDAELDLSYGNSPGQKLDVFPGQQPDSPVLIFIHGGYWRATHVTRSVYSHIAAPLVAAGATEAERPSPRLADSLEVMELLTTWEELCRQ